MKILLILCLFLFPVFNYSQSDDKAKKRIDLTVTAIESNGEKSSKSFVVKKRKYTEQWNYTVSGGNFDSFGVTYRLDNTKYAETYYLQNNRLIHALEREDYYSGRREDSEWLTAWSGEYYFENRRLVFLSTNGHGKSETEEWEPESETLDRFNSRLKELKRKVKMNSRKTGKRP